MGRFEVLKENKKNVKKETKKEKQILEEYKSTEPNIKNTNLKEQSTSKESNTNVKLESEWLKMIKKEKEKSLFNINVNNPKYWDGPIWKGPVMLKGKKLEEKEKKYLEKATNTCCSTIYLSNQDIKWSRDGINWYKKLEDSYTSDHLKAIDDYKWEKNIEYWIKRDKQLYEKRRIESQQNYINTGEINSFMWAELEHIKYEEYCEKLEEIWEQQEKEEEEQENEEEYDEFEEYYDD